MKRYIKASAESLLSPDQFITWHDDIVDIDMYRRNPKEFDEIYKLLGPECDDNVYTAYKHASLSVRSQVSQIVNQINSYEGINF